MPNNEPTSLTLDFQDAGGLSVPTPLPEAVEAAIFSDQSRGSPTPEEIAAIVREHLYDLVDLSLRIAGYEVAMKSGLHPLTGRPSRTDKGRQANRHRATELWKEATCLRLAQYDVYDRAFGIPARRRFQAVVEKLADPAAEKAPPVQRDLF
ncbi:hypothetical protein [Botrimarina hoheduenensis]|uniref:Uncharacterized protein n=1 Tax=Botrimarina hoheduenensis TaxID=2528000 RepID=A0A5C5W0H9_9BACT|nr:hypothetical protein [Botrimarina hoheduenensis]TWT43481.1 hypothetical protein Pla111_24320 [Botrimarina hoheduenensis]